LKGAGGAAPPPSRPGGESPPPGGGEPRPEAPKGEPAKLPPLSASLVVSDGNLVYVDEVLGTRSVIPRFGLEGGLEVDGGVPRFSTSVVIEDARSEQGFLPLLRMFLPLLASADVQAVKLSGGLDFSAEFSASGADAASLRQSLSGSGRLHLKNGAIEGAQGLADLLAKAGVARSGLQFDLVTVQFRFEDGRVYNDDIQVDGKELDLGLKGWTSFDGRMEYAFDGAALLALLPKDARERVTAVLGPDGKIPGTLAGSVTSPSVSLEMPDLADAAKRAATDLLEKEGRDLLKEKGVDLDKIKSGDVDLGGLVGGKKKKPEEKKPDDPKTDG
jgi:hypothetical protein